jgi:hypothetical protein
MGQGPEGGIVAADRIERARPSFQADDEGSIPFTRSIFKIKRNIEGAECALKSARGNGRGNKRPDFELLKTTKPADQRRKRSRWRSRPPPAPPTS